MVAVVFGQGPLNAGNTAYAFADQADVLTTPAWPATRWARPRWTSRWTAVNPVNGQMYLTLTNNSSRTAPTPMPPTRAPIAIQDDRRPDQRQSQWPRHPPARNGDTSEATSFTWDIYAFGAGADLNTANINLSNLDATNDFSSRTAYGSPGPATSRGRGRRDVDPDDDGAYTDAIA